MWWRSEQLWLRRWRRPMRIFERFAAWAVIIGKTLGGAFGLRGQRNSMLVESIETCKVQSPEAISGERSNEVARARVEMPPPLPRPAWIEIDLGRFKRNFELICQHKP